MPSEVLAPKLSALQKAFDSGHLTVAAIYIETCGGVPDHAAELRRQVAKHRLDYLVLDGEGGKINDPTRKRFPWAPHALVVDRRGRIVRTYGHMPSMKSLRQDLASLVATDWIAPRPGDGWREFRIGAWVETRINDTLDPRSETRRLRAIAADSVTVEVLRESDAGGASRREERIFHERPAPDARTGKRTEAEPVTLTVDGRRFRCRVFETTWRRTDRAGREVRVEQRTWVTTDPGSPEALLRRETVERSAAGLEVKSQRRVVALAASCEIQGRTISGWVVEAVRVGPSGRSRERTWYSRQIPGGQVRRVHITRRNGHELEVSSEVVGYGLRRESRER